MNNLKLVVILEFITNLYAFGFVTELILMPILVFTVGIGVYSESKEEYHQVTKIMNFILIVYGICVLAFSIYHVLIDFDKVVTIENLKKFLLAPVLTTTYLPFIYLIALYAAYESFYVRIKLDLKGNKDLVRFVKWRIFFICNLSLKRIKLVSEKLEIYYIKDKNDLKVKLNRIIKQRKNFKSTPLEEV